MLIRIHIPFRSIWPHFRVFLPSLCCPIFCCFNYLIRIVIKNKILSNLVFYVFYYCLIIFHISIIQIEYTVERNMFLLLPLMVKQNARNILPPITRYLLNRLNPIYIVFPSFFVITNNLIYEHFIDPGCSW